MADEVQIQMVGEEEPNETKILDASKVDYIEIGAQSQVVGEEVKQEENPQPQLFEGDRDVLVMSIEISRENLKAKKEIAQKEVNRTGNFLRKHILRQ